MPYTKRRWAPRNRRRNRRKNIYGTKPKFMPRQLAKERYGNVSTKTFYFKTAGSVNSAPNGNTRISWTTQYDLATSATFPDVADSIRVSAAYTEYKVLAVKLRLFAANVGTEPGQQVNAAPDVEGFNRGNSCIFIDQDTVYNEQYPTDIIDVMTRGSARMIPSRAQKWTLTMYRKKGLPGWGTCDQNIAPADRTVDPWGGAIVLIGNNARTGQGIRPLWFFTVTYKIIFRGRNYVT